MTSKTTAFTKPSREGFSASRAVSTENVLLKLTVHIASTYSICSPEFKMVEKIPRRVLTVPSDPALNNGLDNGESNLICRVGDEICPDNSSEVYTIIDLLGTGTFGQVFRCQRRCSGDHVALKIVKSKLAYRKQSLLEIKIVKTLNACFPPDQPHPHIVRMLEHFEYFGHNCIVFELLDFSLFDLLTQNQYRGLPIYLVQRLTKQILLALAVLQDCNIIHCDLKPENILMCSSNQLTSLGGSRSLLDWAATAAATTSTPSQPPSRNSSSSPSTAAAPSRGSSADVAAQAPSPLSSASSAPPSRSADSAPPAPAGGAQSNSLCLKVIDFGSACFEGKAVYSYIQSRFYRAPEVLVGHTYNGAIDMWSLGCVCCEMFLGLPLFPGVSQHNQLARIIEMFGMPSDLLLDGSANTTKYFTLAVAGKGMDSKMSGVDRDSLSGVERTSIGNNSPSGIIRDRTRLVGVSAASVKYRLKTAEEYAADTGTSIPVLKKYLKYDKLDDLILKYASAASSKEPLSSSSGQNGIASSSKESLRRQCFLHFLRGLLAINPWDRWTAKQALQHPFVTNEEFSESFAPAPDPKAIERYSSFLHSGRSTPVSYSGPLSNQKPDRSPAVPPSPSAALGDSNRFPAASRVAPSKEKSPSAGEDINAVKNSSRASHFGSSPSSTRRSPGVASVPRIIDGTTTAYVDHSGRRPISSHSSGYANDLKTRPVPPPFSPGAFYSPFTERYCEQDDQMDSRTASCSYPPPPPRAFAQASQYMVSQPMPPHQYYQSGLDRFARSSYHGGDGGEISIPHARTESDGFVRPEGIDQNYYRGDVSRGLSFDEVHQNQPIASDFGHALTRPAPDQSRLFMSSADPWSYGRYSTSTNAGAESISSQFSPHFQDRGQYWQQYQQQQAVYGKPLGNLYQPHVGGISRSHDSYTSCGLSAMMEQQGHGRYGDTGIIRNPPLPPGPPPMHLSVRAEEYTSPESSPYFHLSPHGHPSQHPPQFMHHYSKGNRHQKPFRNSLSGTMSSSYDPARGQKSYKHSMAPHQQKQSQHDRMGSAKAHNVDDSRDNFRDVAVRNSIAEKRPYSNASSSASSFSFPVTTEDLKQAENVHKEASDVLLSVEYPNSGSAQERPSDESESNKDDTHLFFGNEDDFV
jgi:serine/threonine protein kinase